VAHLGPEPGEHILDHVVALDEEPPRANLGRGVPVADVPGEPRQRRGLRRHLRERLRRRLDRDERPVLEHGAGRSDAVLLASAWRANDPGPVAELAEALAPSAERRLETMAQGAAFARVTAAAWGIEVPAAAYPVAAGAAARRLGMPLARTATLYQQGFAANLVSAGVRLVPLGQTEGQRLLADLLPLAARVAEAALAAPEDAVGGIALAADLAAMRHETQYTRLYRS
jgi:urease accessory protein